MRSHPTRVRTVALLVTVPIVLFGIGWLGGFRINLTPSYPLGLWRIVPLDHDAAVGDLIVICPPDNPVFAAAWERGYLRYGLCHGWVSPLIKTVAATSGQHVEIGESVVIDGKPVAHSSLRQTDAEGRMLVAHLSGFVPDGHLYLHSDFAGSYDSRYFGPIPDAGLLGLARPVFTVAP